MRPSSIVSLALAAALVAMAAPVLAAPNPAFVDGCAKYEVAEGAWELAPGAPPLDIDLEFTDFRDGEPTAFTMSSSNYEFVSLKAAKYVGDLDGYDGRHAISHIVFCRAEVGG